MNPFQDVFISYGRADSRMFASKLNDRLTKAGLEVWFDFDDIPLGVDYQKQIDDGIDKADNFLFLIAPHSVNSSYCRLEIDLALKRHKRILPLLHVESITRETWQQRNPHGTDTEWEAYREKGLHSSFPNMHPEISKINWVYFREGIDDFEKSFQDLLELLERDRDYVHQHTLILDQALTWERHHHRPRHLLSEAALQQAEVWLQTEFRDRQPPCTPTQLHCQFISESLKYAQGGLTDVFLSHAEADYAELQALYAALTRAGLTIWTNQQDIQTGVDFKAAIDLGIEGADNVVYLLSTASLQSPWCQHELDYALALNKRIIPVLIRAMDLEELPASLRNLQFIDLTQFSTDEGRTVAAGKLLATLRQDADYYRTHKLLLAKALKWERQLRNPSILLQGYSLRQTAGWLEVAQKHARHGPLPLQMEFVAESQKQPSDVRLNVFIASDPKDTEFARKLNETLQIQGERTWFEPEKTVLGADYLPLMREALERTENVLLVASEEALADPEVREELALTASLSKRIVAVSYREEARSLLPPALEHLPWVDFNSQAEDFTGVFGNLYRILKSHPEHVRDHTRLLTRALTWDQAQRDDSLLLRGKELTKAEQWLAQSAGQTPPPADLHRDYITASRALSVRQVKPRSLIGLSLGTTLLVLVARFMGLLQGLELFAYDHLLRQQPNEAPDDRFLIVSVEATSGSFLREGLIGGTYTPSIGTLPDDALQAALTILQENQAGFIGLDFYRDFPASEPLATTLRNTENLITVCKSADDAGVGVKKAPESPLDQVGFGDFLGDRQAGADFIRRHYVMKEPEPEFCDTSISFSLQLADRYLQAQGLTFTSPAKPEGGFRGNSLRWGDLVVPNLNLARGPYYTDPTALDGYQTLLNFRTGRQPDQPLRTKDPAAFAPSVTLVELLTGQVPRDLIADRIVLIGYTDYADRNADYYETPHGALPGVFLQGQMTSQLISAALDDRPLIRWWSFPSEAAWILVWAGIGGLIVRQGVRVSRIAGGSVIAIVVLYGSSYLAMVTSSLWIPLVPPLLTFALTAGGVAILTYRLRHP